MQTQTHRTWITCSYLKLFLKNNRSILKTIIQICSNCERKQKEINVTIIYIKLFLIMNNNLINLLTNLDLKITLTLPTVAVLIIKSYPAQCSTITTLSTTNSPPQVINTQHFIWTLKPKTNPKSHLSDSEPTISQSVIAKQHCQWK